MAYGFLPPRNKKYLSHVSTVDLLSKEASLLKSSVFIGWRRLGGGERRQAVAGVDTFMGVLRSSQELEVLETAVELSLPRGYSKQPTRAALDHPYLAC